jgi:ATP-dependent Clp protease ATP-binding subunit ClpA
MKDIKNVIPPFSSPARIWAHKIKLICPTPNDAPARLIDAIKQQLPPSLYDAVVESDYKTHLALLDKICELDGPTVNQAAESLFESKAQLRSNQLPREYFHEIKRAIQLIFPEYQQETVKSMAWQKLLMALPISMQHTMALLPKQNVSEEALDSIDKAWRLLAPSTCASLQATPTNTPLDATTIALEKINERLKRLEAKTQTEDEMCAATMRRLYAPGMGNRPSRHYTSKEGIQPNNNYCFYHNKFGIHAHKCAQPCSFGNRKALN